MIYKSKYDNKDDCIMHMCEKQGEVLIKSHFYIFGVSYFQYYLRNGIYIKQYNDDNQDFKLLSNGVFVTI